MVNLEFSQGKGNTLQCHLHGTTTAFFNDHVICFFFRDSTANTHNNAYLPSIIQSICKKRVVKFQEKKSKCLEKAVLQEHMKNHMPYKPPPASQHFLKSSILICLRCLTSDNLSLPPISILKIKCFTRITSQIARDKKIQIFQ